jgi:hypothetical protein
MIYVTAAKHVKDYVIALQFNTQVSGVVDLADTILHDHRPIVTELRDIEKFKRFQVDLDTVVWENGLDFAPEFLLEKLKDAKTNAEFFENMNS